MNQGTMYLASIGISSLFTCSSCYSSNPSTIINLFSPIFVLIISEVCAANSHQQVKTLTSNLPRPNSPEDINYEARIAMIAKEIHFKPANLTHNIEHGDEPSNRERRKKRPSVGRRKGRSSDWPNLQTGSFKAPKLTTLGLQPTFDQRIKRNITVPLGGTAFLQCKINNLADKTVSWVRQKDLHILTSGRETYTSDNRVRSINLSNSNEWTLEIKDTKLTDSGVYECQISTDPKLSTSVHLRVLELKTLILEGNEVYLRKAADINLTCLINYSPDPSSNFMIMWEHNKQIINFDPRNRGVKIENREVLTSSKVTLSSASSPSPSEKFLSEKALSSSLLISSSQPSDSGNYTCHLSSTSLPSHYSKPATIRVYIMNGGENPAAMQGGASSGHLIRASSRFYLLTLLLKVFRIHVFMPIIVCFFQLKFSFS